MRGAKSQIFFILPKYKIFYAERLVRRRERKKGTVGKREIRKRKGDGEPPGREGRGGGTNVPGARMTSVGRYR